MTFLNAARLRIAACALVAAASSADAALFRAYLSVKGNDANDCSLAAPCRLLTAALAAVNDGGEIWMLDSGNFNSGTVTVAKSVTVLAIPGAQGSLVVNNARALEVNGAGIRVTLRNIGFRDLGSSGHFGLFYLQGASLVLDNCRFANMGSGVTAAAPGGSLVVRDSIFRQNSGIAIDLSDSVDALVTGSELVDSGNNGISIQGNAKLVVRESIISGNSGGIVAQNFQAGTIQILVERSTLSANSSAGLLAFADVVGGVIQATVARSTIVANGFAGISSQAAVGATATVVIDGNTFAQQPRGVHIGGGTVRSRQNNIFNFHTNVPGDVDGGSLTNHPGL